MSLPDVSVSDLKEAAAVEALRDLESKASLSSFRAKLKYWTGLDRAIAFHRDGTFLVGSCRCGDGAADRALSDSERAGILLHIF